MVASQKPRSKERVTGRINLLLLSCPSVTRQNNGSGGRRVFAVKSAGTSFKAVALTTSWVKSLVKNKAFTYFSLAEATL